MLWHNYVGSDKKETLCFLHGLGGSSSAFDFVKKHFSKSYNMLLIDLQSQGYSKKFAPSTHSFADQCKLINDVLSKEKIKKVILVGHCYGGMVAQEMYKLYPNKISKLILINTHFKPRKSLILRMFVPLILQGLRVLSWFGIRTKYNYGHDDYRPYRNTRDINFKLFFMSVLKYTPLPIYLPLLHDTYVYDNVKNLSKIRVPTLIIHGKKDLFFPYKEVQQLSNNIKNAKFVLIKDANHYTPVTKPKKMIKVIDNFLSIS